MPNSANAPTATAIPQVRSNVVARIDAPGTLGWLVGRATVRRTAGYEPAQDVQSGRDRPEHKDTLVHGHRVETDYPGIEEDPVARVCAEGKEHDP